MGDGGGAAGAPLQVPLQVPLSRLGASAEALEAAAAALDRAGGAGAAGGGDLGDAEVVVTSALAVAAEGAARVAAETHVLGAALRLCRDDLRAADLEAAVDLFRVDP